MKVKILYYSPTKNTKYVAEKIKYEFESYGEKHAEKENNDVITGVSLDIAKDNSQTNFEVFQNSYSNISVELCDVTKGNVPDLQGVDLVFLGYPIHAFNPPKAFYQVVKRLNFEKGQKVFIFKTSGQPHPFNNASSKDIKRVIRKEKGEVISDVHFLMPYYIMFRHSDELVKKMVMTNDDLIKAYVDGVIKGKKYFVKSNVFCNLISDIFKIEWSGASLLGRKFVTTSDCDCCGVCVKNCPLNNVKIENGKAVHGKNCNICMSCVAFCPKNAVNTRYMERWKVVGKYNFDSISKNETLSGDYIKTTKEFLGIYHNYFANAEKLIKEYYENEKGNTDNATKNLNAENIERVTDCENTNVAFDKSYFTKDDINNSYENDDDAAAIVATK